MAADPQLPRPQSVLIDSRNWPTTEWHRFWSQLLVFVRENGGTQEQLAGIEARVTALENSVGASILGLQSITVTGSLESGSVVITLDNDQDAPGNTYYYGTGPTGVKGFFTVSDAVEGDDSIVKTVGGDGVSTFALDGDDPSPGNNEYYGTDGSGVKGFHPVPGASGVAFQEAVYLISAGF
jgi:hypothetical protein